MKPKHHFWLIFWPLSHTWLNFFLNQAKNNITPSSKAIRSLTPLPFAQHKWLVKWNSFITYQDGKMQCQSPVDPKWYPIHVPETTTKQLHCWSYFSQIFWVQHFLSVHPSVRLYAMFTCTCTGWMTIFQIFQWQVGLTANVKLHFFSQCTEIRKKVSSYNYLSIFSYLSDFRSLDSWDNSLDECIIHHVCLRKITWHDRMMHEEDLVL